MTNKVLVLTDSFPPEVKGGAELSLKSTLDQLAADGQWRIEVLALSSQESRLETEPYPVHRMRFPKRWPPIGAGCRTNNTMQFVFGGDGNKTKRLTRVLRAGTFLASGNRSGFNVLEDDLVEAGVSCRAQIEREMDAFQPDLIHADNVLSILLTANLRNLSAPWLAKVRDSRFLCSHPATIVCADGQACGSCEFACLREQPLLIRGMMRSNMSIVRDYRRGAINKASAIGVTSCFLRDQIARIAPGKPIHLIPNGVANIASPDEAGLPRKRRIILFVGSLTEPKGPDILLNAFAEIAATFPDVDLVLAGDGEMRSVLDQLASAHRIDSRVKFLGWVDRAALDPWYQRASFVVCPGRVPEAFGRVPVEAAQFGVPAIAFGEGGLAEIIKHEETGLLVPYLDQQAFMESICRLLSDNQLLSRLRESSSQIATEYGVEQSASAMSDCWTQVIADA